MAGIIVATLRISSGQCFYLCGACGKATDLQPHCSQKHCWWVVCPCGCINKYPWEKKKK